MLRDREAIPAPAAWFGADHALNASVVRALTAIAQDDAAAERVLIRAMDSPHGTVRIQAAGGVIGRHSR